MFSNQLKELRKNNEISQKTLSEKTGIAQSVICYYENGKVAPSADALIKLADYFNVSTDYLLGREDDFGNIITQSTAPAFECTEKEKKLISFYRKLKPQTQNYIFGLVENLAVSG